MSDSSTVSDSSSIKEALLAKQAASRQEKSKNNTSIDDTDIIDEKDDPIVPLREDMVSNATKFLSHDNVKRTPLVRRVAFLEQKGLTNEEITEALRRVGINNSASSNTSPSVNNIQSQTQPIYNQNQPPPIPVRSNIQYIQPQPSPPPPRSTFKVVATSVILTLSAVAGLSFLFRGFVRKQLIEDKNNNENNHNNHEHLTRNISIDDKQLSSTNKSDNLSNSVSELVQVVKSQREDVNNTLKMVHTVLNTPEKQNTPNLSDQINVKELTSAISELHTLLRQNQTPNIKNTPSNIPPQSPTSTVTPLRSTKPTQVSSPWSNNTTISNPNTPKTETKNESVQKPKQSFSDIMKMVQAGEKPPNVKDINDSPLDPSAVISPSTTSSPLKPWEKRRQQRVKSIPTGIVSTPSYLQDKINTEEKEEHIDNTKEENIEESVDNNTMEENKEENKEEIINIPIEETIDDTNDDTQVIIEDINNNIENV